MKPTIKTGARRTSMSRTGIAKNIKTRNAHLIKKQQELEKYIKQNLKKGFNKATLRKALIQHGWQPNMVDNALKKLKV